MRRADELAQDLHGPGDHGDRRRNRPAACVGADTAHVRASLSGERLRPWQLRSGLGPRCWSSPDRRAASTPCVQRMSIRRPRSGASKEAAA